MPPRTFNGLQRAQDSLELALVPCVLRAEDDSVQKMADCLDDWLVGFLLLCLQSNFINRRHKTDEKRQL